MSRTDVDTTGATATTGTTAPAVRNVRHTDLVVISVLALVVWVGLVYLGRTWGLFLEVSGRQILLFTPPVLGGYRIEVTMAFWLPVVVAVVLIVVLPELASRLRWRATLVLGAVSALAWWIALALIDGINGVTDGLHWGADFDGKVQPIAADPHGFLSTFVERLPTFGIQVRAHPPGLPLLLAAFEKIGLGGPGWATAAVLLSASLGVVAVLIAIREVVDEDTARRALPFLALAPAAAWIATSFDALYLGVAAWFVTALILAMKRTDRRADLLAVAAGVLAAATIMLSYGLILMGCGALIAAVALRRWRPLVIAAGTALLCILAFVPFGYWWIAGLIGTKEQYDSFGLDRPYSYFVVNNLSAWALVLGPATFVALARLRDRRLWILVGGGLAAALVADATGLSNAEVERIWLPFAIWVLPAAAVLGGHRFATRGWLAAQAGSALVLALFISPYW